MKDNRGEITIMMIITVIVLIILGGICIFMLTGENGLFIPKGEEQNVQQDNNSINTNVQEEETNNTVNADEQQNVTNNENGALTVPVE